MDESLYGRIRAAIRKRYDEVARSPGRLFAYPTGREGLRKLGYHEDFVGSLPDATADSFCGVGNPFAAGEILPGDVVLDAGCGAGVDMIRAAARTGPTGQVVGVDLTASMVEKANRNLRAAGLANARAEEGSIESLPFSDGTFDVVTSNGVLNLSPRKRMFLAEIHRVLKPGGRFLLSDMVLEGERPGESAFDPDAWST